MTPTMLTSERLTAVNWALGKIQDAEKAVERLLEDEPIGQPPTERRVQMEKIAVELARLEKQLEALYS